MDRTTIRRRALRIAGIFLAVGILWIFYSDKLLLNVLPEQITELAAYQTYKGWLFVVLTAILIYLLASRALRNQAGILKRLAQSETKYQELYDHAPDMFASADPATRRIVQCNQTLCDTLGYTKEEIIGRDLFELYHPDCHVELQRVFQSFITTGEVRDRELQLRRRDGTTLDVSVNVAAVRDANGNILYSDAVFRDITESGFNRRLLALEKELAEMIAARIELIKILDTLNLGVASLLRDAIPSVLFYDAGKHCVRHGSAPGLPASYNRAIDGQNIGANAGSCGTAIQRNAQVIVSDISADPLWVDYRELALGHGLRACWSTPIRAADGRILGTFAVYYREPRAPSERELDLIDRMTHLAGIAMENDLTLRELRFEQENLNLAQQIGKIGSWETDVDLNHSVWSQEMYRLANRDPALGPFRHVDEYFERIHPDDRQGVYDRYTQLLKDGRGYTIEFRGNPEHGPLRYYYSIARAIRDETGRIIKLAGILQDVTERKEAEIALRQSETHFRVLFEQSTDGIFVADPEEHFLDVNTAGCQLTGYTRDALLGMKIMDLLVPEELERLTTLIDRLHGGSVITSEWKFRRKDGSIFLGEVTSKQMTDGRLQGILRDITELRRAEAALRESEKQLHQLTARLVTVREEESARIAREIHDVMAQDLTRLKIDLSLAAKRYTGATKTTGGQDMRDKFRDLIGQTDAAIETVQKIATELRPVVLDSLGLAAAIEWQAEKFEHENGVRCRAELPAELQVRDRDQATALFRILQECLTNVLRHAEATEVTVRLAGDGEDLEMNVSDNGRGIPPEKINDPRSIGLFGMRERVAMFGGRLEIQGAPGAGTTVTARIPLVQRCAGAQR